MSESKTTGVKKYGDILINICERENIELIKLSHSKFEELFANCGGGVAVAYSEGECTNKTIAFDESRGKIEKHLIIAHEIAHHIFGHLTPSCTTDIQFEATIFSLVFTAIGIYKDFEQETQSAEVRALKRGKTRRHTSTYPTRNIASKRNPRRL